MSEALKIGLNLVALSDQRSSGVEAFVKNVLGRVRVGSKGEISIALRRTLPVKEALGAQFIQENKNVLISRWRVKRTGFRVPIEMVLLSLKFFDCDTVLSVNNFGPLFGKASQKRAVFIYDIWFLDPSYNGGFIKKIVFALLIKIQLAHTHKVFTISEHSKTAIVNRLGVKADKVVILPFVMEPPSLRRKYRTSTNSESGQESAKTDNSTPYLLLIGSDRANKNVWNAIVGYIGFLGRGCVLGPDLIVVGQFSTVYISKITKLLDSVGMNRVKIFGFVTRSEYVELMRAAQGVVFLSLYEGLGIPVLEAIAKNKPILVSKGTVCQEIAGPLGIAVDGNKLKEIEGGYEQLAEFISKDQSYAASHLKKYVDCEKGPRILKNFLLSEFI